MQIGSGVLNFCLLAWIFATSLQAQASDPSFRFQDVAAAVGLKHRTVYGGRGTNKYLLETTGCGAAFLDYDNDGLLDIFLVNGSQLEGFSGESPPVSRLYRNTGTSFQDVTDKAGVGRHGWGQAVCSADYDNDGFEDILVTYWGNNALFRNKGDGTFEEVSQESGLSQDRRRWNSGCAFLDHDRDGDLDLFVANYIDLDLAEAPTPDSGLCLYKGVRVACGPPGLAGGKNILYLNRGDGTFQDVSSRSGIADAQGTYALGAVSLDFDQDGWPDIYVANDSNPATLYQNQKDGRFEDVGILAGVAYSQDGKPQAGMGVAAADVNRDGRIDLFKTNFAEDTVNLYLNAGQGFFEEVTFEAGLGVNTRWLGWGCGLVDLDNDGWVDIFEVNGHVYPEVRQLGDSTSYRQRKVIYRNLANGRFADVSLMAGRDVTVPRAGRGAAFGDYDNDGDIDVLVNNVHDEPSLYRNEQQSGHHWIQFRLLGVKSNRSAVGARLSLKAGKAEQVGEVRSGGSYYSQNQLGLHFGMGSSAKVDQLEIRWPSGQIDRFKDIAADRLWYVREGSGKLTAVRPN